MKCKSCGKEIEKKSKVCPHCGNVAEQSKLKAVIISIVAALAVVMVASMVLGMVSCSNKEDPIETSLELGYKYLEEGRYEEAILEFDKVLKIDEKNTDAIIGTADAYIGLDQFDQAASFMEECIGKDKENTELYNKLVDMYTNNGDYENANRIINMAEENGCVVEGGEFECRRNIIEVNGKVVTVSYSGVTVRDVDSYVDEQISSYSGYNSYFATNGKKAYLYDHYNFEIVELDLESGETKALAETHVGRQHEIDSELIEEGHIGNILWCYDGYLYFSELYGAYDSSETQECVLDLSTGEYRKLGISVYSIGEIDSYNGKIYYREMNMDLIGDTLYEANPDGSNERVFLENVASFRVVGDKLYYSYCEPMSEEGTVYSLDFVTGETICIEEIERFYTEVIFRDTYYLTYTEDVTATIKYFDGREQVIGRGTTCIGKDYVVTETFNETGCNYVLWKNGKSVTIPIYDEQFILGYGGGRIYYTDGYTTLENFDVIRFVDVEI